MNPPPPVTTIIPPLSTSVSPVMAIPPTAQFGQATQYRVPSGTSARLEREMNTWAGAPGLAENLECRSSVAPAGARSSNPCCRSDQHRSRIRCSPTRRSRGRSLAIPLELVFCGECTLVQITLSVPPEDMFEEYAYFSSFADTVVENARAISTRLIAERKLGPNDLAMEIASNDGYLLRNYVDAGVPVLGVDPARNIASVAEENGVPTVCDFFGAEVAAQLRAEGRRASVLHANNVLAHVPDVNGVVAGIATILADDGVAVIETPYLRDLVDELEFDTIYHEHLFYYSAHALRRVVRAQRPGDRRRRAPPDPRGLVARVRGSGRQHTAGSRRRRAARGGARSRA